MTPYEADMLRDKINDQEHYIACYMRSTFEELIEQVAEAARDFDSNVKTVCPDYDGNEDLRAAEQRLRDVLRLAM